MTTSLMMRSRSLPQRRLEALPAVDGRDDFKARLGQRDGDSGDDPVVVVDHQDPAERRVSSWFTSTLVNARSGPGERSVENEPVGRFRRKLRQICRYRRLRSRPRSRFLILAVVVACQDEHRHGVGCRGESLHVVGDRRDHVAAGFEAAPGHQEGGADLDPMGFDPSKKSTRTIRVSGSTATGLKGERSALVAGAARSGETSRMKGAWLPPSPASWGLRGSVVAAVVAGVPPPDDPPPPLQAGIRKSAAKTGRILRSIPIVRLLARLPDRSSGKRHCYEAPEGPRTL
jgi:hypothetical protein